ncbi:MAG: poly-gamma-glutamate biosynthesis protein PgsC [Flavobacteriales bacterium]|nr:poly-gamma-glutamate biosynthesis protein PgsC [Flavobacteriales bacterium]
MIELAVTIGIVLSLLFVEAFGMAAGGIIVPGYIALQLTSPDRIIGVLVIAFITFLLVKLISRYTFLFGRRQMVVSLLIGTIFSIISHHYLFFNMATTTLEFSAVGWVVPGLIAHWSVKQGYLKTLSMLAITSVLVRLLVMLIFWGELIPDLY